MVPAVAARLRVDQSGRPSVGEGLRPRLRGRGRQAARSRVVTAGRPDETALWRSVQRTLEDLVIPSLKPGFERDNARQLVGLVRYALARDVAAPEARVGALAEALGSEADDSTTVLSRAADLLVS